MEAVTSSKLIADHLNSLHSVRKACIESESSDKMRRALKSQTRTATALIYDTGDKVYYRKNTEKKWQGPGHVVGIDNKQIFVKHGGEIYRVSPINIQPENVNAEPESQGSMTNNEELVEHESESEEDELVSGL